MQGGNRFLDFANEIMARHRGLGFGFEPASMLHLEDRQQGSLESVASSNNYVTNLYHIQNIKEENYLFKQNLSFLTQVLENKMYKTLYPSVEKQIEKLIREEMPQAEIKIVHSVSEQMLKLVQQGGIETFEVIKEKVLSEYKETEKTTLKEQERLFRKIENIWNSSVYQQTVQNNYSGNTQSNTKSIHQNFTEEKNSTYHQQLQQHVQIGENYPVQQSQLINQSQFVQKSQLINQSQFVQQNQLMNQSQFVQQNHQIQPIEIVHLENQQTEVFESQILNERTLNERQTVKENHYLKDYETVKDHHYLKNNETIKESNYLKEHEKVKENYHEKNREDNYKESVLERTLKIIESQNQIINHVQNQHIGNIGKIYENIGTISISGTHPVYIQELPVMLQDTILQTIEHQLPQRVSVRQDHIHLEYPTEETTQVQQEIMEMLHSEIQRIPDVPQIVKEVTEKHSKAKSISEQILSRMENIINVHDFETNSATNLVTNSVTNLVTNSVTKTVTLNKLSHAILEYAEEKTTSEQLQSNMLRILEDYQTEVITVPGESSTRRIYNNHAELVTIESIKNNINHRMIQTIRNKGNEPVLIQAMEPAAIVYRSEEEQIPGQNEKTKQLEKQVNEVVKTIKNVEQKTIVQKEQLIEQQRKVVREVLKENSDVWAEGKGAGYIRNEVQQSVEEQINQSVNQIANRVYRRLEDKLKSERGRRGLI